MKVARRLLAVFMSLQLGYFSVTKSIGTELRSDEVGGQVPRPSARDHSPLGSRSARYWNHAGLEDSYDSRSDSSEVRFVGRTLAETDQTASSSLFMLKINAINISKPFDYIPGLSGTCDRLQAQNSDLEQGASWRFNGTFLSLSATFLLPGEFRVDALFVETGEGGPQTFQGVLRNDKIATLEGNIATLTYFSGNPTELIPPCSGHGTCYFGGLSDAAYSRCVCDEDFVVSSGDSSECVTFRPRYVHAGKEATSNSGSRSEPYANLTYALQMSMPNAVREPDDFEVLSLLPGTYIPSTNPMIYLPQESSIFSITSTNGSAVTILDCEYKIQGLVVGKDILQVSGLTIRRCVAFCKTFAVAHGVPRAEQLPRHPLFSFVDFGWNNEALGAALLARQGIQLDLLNVTMENNRAGYQGGAIAVQLNNAEHRDSTTVLSIKSSVFRGNTAGCGGGAVAVLDSNPSVYLEETIFTDNRAEYAGALFFHSGVATVTARKSRFERNQAAAGGAIKAHFDGAFTVVDSLFDSNEALRGGRITSYCRAGSDSLLHEGDGGALDIHGATVSLIDAVFSNCAAVRGGGLTALDLPRSTEAPSAQITLLTVLFTNNTASQYGGAFFTANIPLLVQSSALFHNSAGAGGGIVGSGSKIVLMDSTLLGNRAHGEGGGILLKDGCRVQLCSSVLIYNYANHQGGALHCSDDGFVLTEDSSYVSNAVGEHGSGGAMSLAHFCTLSVVAVTMVQNVAGVRGGALTVLPHSTASIDVYSVKLIDNQALFGGGAMAFVDLKRLDISLTDVSFSRNTCQKGGGGALLADSPVLCNNCKTTSNSAKYADNFMTTDIRLEPMSPPYNNSRVVYAVSGEVIPTLLVQLVDSYLNNIAPISYTEVLVLESDASQISGNRARMFDGHARFANVTLKAPPGSSLQLSLSCEYLSRALNFTVLLRECYEGEGLSEDLLVCESCAAQNGFSISPQQPCVRCAADEVVNEKECTPKFSVGSYFDNCAGCPSANSLWAAVCIASFFLLVLTFAAVRSTRTSDFRAKRKEQVKDHEEQLFAFEDRQTSILESNSLLYEKEIRKMFSAATFHLQKHMDSKRKPSDDSMTTLNSVLQLLSDGQIFCKNQQLCERVLLKKYVPHPRVVNLREVFTSEFKHRNLHWHLDDNFPEHIQVDYTLFFSMLYVAIVHAAHRYENAPHLRCRVSDGRTLTASLSHGRAKKKKPKTSSGKPSSQTSTQTPWFPNLSFCCEDMGLEHCRHMADMLRGEVDLSFDDQGVHLSLQIACEVVFPSGSNGDFCLLGSSEVIYGLDDPEPESESELESEPESEPEPEPELPPPGCDLQPKADGFEGMSGGSRVEADLCPSTSLEIRCYENTDPTLPLSTVVEELEDGPQTASFLWFDESNGEADGADGPVFRLGNWNSESREERSRSSTISSSLETYTINPDPLPAGLRYAVAGESLRTICTLKDVVMTSLKGSANSIFCCEDRRDILGFVDKVLSTTPPVDICIIDQHLNDVENPGGPPIISGTAIIHDLQVSGFTGMAIIRGTIDSEYEFQAMNEVGVSGILMKTACNAEVVDRITEWWHRHCTSTSDT
ncbi:hypothetical protein CYMTET_38687 [Cymbomonas tetramitiformis]|uniref:Uncharacterized protein n=1 Tax=Cymbomonas tetramitiformis TaxID=36881 RepID=A0AAE0CBH6_9CHLO|nr:hypothetical protein CYMTET_38687 [Cymbomonas tetramitiformis]